MGNTEAWYEIALKEIDKEKFNGEDTVEVGVGTVESVENKTEVETENDDTPTNEEDTLPDADVPTDDGIIYSDDGGYDDEEEEEDDSDYWDTGSSDEYELENYDDDDEEYSDDDSTSSIPEAPKVEKPKYDAYDEYALDDYGTEDDDEYSMDYGDEDKGEEVYTPTEVIVPIKEDIKIPEPEIVKVDRVERVMDTTPIGNSNTELEILRAKAELQRLENEGLRLKQLNGSGVTNAQESKGLAEFTPDKSPSIKADSLEKQAPKLSKLDKEILMFNKMSNDKLIGYVKQYLDKKNISKHLVEIDELKKRFGNENIARLVKAGYIIRYGKRVTIGK